MFTSWQYLLYYFYAYLKNVKKYYFIKVKHSIFVFFYYY